MVASSLIKENVQQLWEKRSKRAHKKLARLETWLEHECYELEIARRLLHRAPNEEARDGWQIHVEVLESAVKQTEWRIDEERSELALCEAMLEEMRTDVETSRIED